MGKGIDDLRWYMDSRFNDDKRLDKIEIRLTKLEERPSSLSAILISTPELVP